MFFWASLASPLAHGADIGRSVDDYFDSNELSVIRVPSSHDVDRCNLSHVATFFSATAESVGEHLRPRDMDLSYLAKPDYLWNSSREPKY